jgi:hypothetical protein
MFPKTMTWTKTVVTDPPKDPDDSVRMTWLSEAIMAGASVARGDHGVAISWKDKAFCRTTTVECHTLRDAISAAMRDLPDPKTLERFSST